MFSKISHMQDKMEEQKHLEELKDQLGDDYEKHPLFRPSTIDKPTESFLLKIRGAES